MSNIWFWRLWWRLSARCHRFDPDAKTGTCRICRWERPVWENDTAAGQRRIRRAHDNLGPLPRKRRAS